MLFDWPGVQPYNQELCSRWRDRAASNATPYHHHDPSNNVASSQSKSVASIHNIGWLVGCYGYPSQYHQFTNIASIHNIGWLVGLVIQVNIINSPIQPGQFTIFVDCFG
jgi:hypothetical protein